MRHLAPPLLGLLLAGCPTPPADPPDPDPATDAPAAETDAPPAAPTLEPLPVPDVALTEPRYAATHVLVAWAGAPSAPEGVTRTRAEARTLATELRQRALAGEELEDLARTHSDGPSGPRGGSVGVYARTTMMPSFEKAVASVPVGKIAPLVETPYGVHVIRRDAVVEARLWHVQVAFEGAWRASTTRSRDEARARIEEAIAALDAGTDPAEVARRFSDDPSAADNGGDLGRVAPGQLIPAFEQAAFALSPGERSAIVETPYGLHVIRRLPDAAP